MKKNRGGKRLPYESIQLFVGCIVFFCTNFSFAQPIPISLPTISVEPGSTIDIPVLSGDLTNREVLKYTAIVLFDPDVIQAVGANSQGTLSEPFGQPEVTLLDSVIVVVGEGGGPLSGSGVLVNLRFEVLGEIEEMSTLQWVGFLFNTGIPPVALENGKVTVQPPTIPDIRVEPLVVDFGPVLVDSTRLRQVTIANDGTAELVVSATNLVGADAPQFGIVNSGSLLKVSPRDSLTLTISFTPDLASERNALLEILSNDPDEDTVLVALNGLGFERLQLQTDIISPDSGSVICGDSVTVNVSASITGGVPPFEVECEINGEPANFVGDRFVATVPVASGENVIVAACAVEDSLGTTLSARDSVSVTVPEAPTCFAQILSPADGTTVNDDATVVSGSIRVEGGQPPFSITCTVNDVPAAVSDSVFSTSVPLSVGENDIIAVCVVVDSCGNETVCSDTIRVVREEPELSCSVEITSPASGEFVCGDSVEVAAVTTVRGGILPITIDCTVNGVAATLTDSSCVAKVPVTPDQNEIVIVCVVSDGGGNKAICTDTVTVFIDEQPPTCSFSPQGLSLVGRFEDAGTGIASVQPLDLRNAQLTVDPFVPGAKSVSFRIDILDFRRPFGFNIEVTDLCGNSFLCDPIFVTLSTDRPERLVEFTFPKLDRYMQISNNGLTEIRVDLNGEKFRLVTDPSALKKNNTFLIPEKGRLTIDLIDYLHDGENQIALAYDGPPSSLAELQLLNEVENVDFVLHLQSIPDAFRLTQNYPNPFNPSTTIAYSIPAEADGERIQLRIYNLLGELVRILVDAEKPAGNYLAQWDGRNHRGAAVSSGIYVYRLVGATFSQSRRMVLMR